MQGFKFLRQLVDTVDPDGESYLSHAFGLPIDIEGGEV